MNKLGTLGVEFTVKDQRACARGDLDPRWACRRSSESGRARRGGRGPLGTSVNGDIAECLMSEGACKKGECEGAVGDSEKGVGRGGYCFLVTAPIVPRRPP